MLYLKTQNWKSSQHHHQQQQQQQFRQIHGLGFAADEKKPCNSLLKRSWQSWAGSTQIDPDQDISLGRFNVQKREQEIFFPNMKKASSVHAVISERDEPSPALGNPTENISALSPKLAIFIARIVCTWKEEKCWKRSRPRQRRKIPTRFFPSPFWHLWQ